MNNHKTLSTNDLVECPECINEVPRGEECPVCTDQEPPEYYMNTREELIVAWERSSRYAPNDDARFAKFLELLEEVKS